MHPNEELLRNSFYAFGRGDMDTLRANFTEDIVWHFPGKSPMGGEFPGVDETLGWLGRTFELSGGTIRTEVHDVLANDTQAVALFTVTAQRDGKSLDDHTVGVYEIEGGNVREAWFHPGDQYATDDFWS